MPVRLVAILSAMLLAAVLGAAPPAAQAQGAPYQLPMIGKNRGTPLLMLNLSKDHQLSYRAYVEFADLDGDGQLEVSYKHSIEYYGYFDAYRCYSYADGRFSPISYSSDKYCAGQWSGNFLNWATMTRLDIIRRILYGGTRSTDTSGSTVLERAYLPTDAHSFAKYYAGSDINRLTPFTLVSEISICNTTPGGTGADRASHTNTQPPLMRVAAGNYQLWNNNERWQCYWSEDKWAAWTSDPSDKTRTGLNAEISNPSRATNGLRSGGNGPDYIVRVQACVGDEPPPSQATTERCFRYPSGNRKPVGLLHEFGQENRMLFGLTTGSFERNISGGVLRSNVLSFRDEVNVDTDGSFKSSKVDGRGAVIADERGIVWNIDRLRIYGYDYNDGTYIGLDNTCTYQMIGLSNGRCRSWGNPMSEIYTESLRYFAGKTPTSGFQTSGGADEALRLSAPNWRDPFKPWRRSGGSTDASWRLPGVNLCSPLHVLNLNASVSSWDSDEVDLIGVGAPRSAAAYTADVGAGEGLNGSRRPIGESGGVRDGVCTPKTITDLGAVAGLCPESPTQKGSFLMAGAAYWAHTSRIRDDLVGVPADSDQIKPLRVNTLGVAMATNTPVIRIPVPPRAGLTPSGAPSYVTLQPTYLLDLGGRYGNGTLVDFRVVYQDLAAGQGRFYVNWEDSEQGGDYDQDVSGYIKYWFSADRTKLFVETHATGYSSGNPQGLGYIITGTAQDGPRFHSGAANFSYGQPNPVDIFRATGNFDQRVSTLSATRINGVAGSRINANGGCDRCLSANGWDTGGVPVDDRGKPAVAVYDVVGSAGETLRDPMWYAAKWGGFDDLDGDGKPGSLGEWARRNRSRPPYASMSDAQAAQVVPPDNYFYASNPSLLPKALRDALIVVDESNLSRSGVTLTSRVLTPDGDRTGTRAFTASFTGDWSGEVTAWGFDTRGVPVARANASERLTSRTPASRQIVTRGLSGGVPFEWSRLDSAFRSSLDIDPVTGSADGLGSARLDYLRGVPDNEVRLGGRFRDRARRLGDVVNSTPAYVGAPRRLQPIGAPDSSYETFKTAQASRRPMVYVGANDGMLHGFDAATMDEKIAYVPRMLSDRLRTLTDPAYEHRFFVDGSPFSADMKVDGAWRTLLFTSLGAGGQGLFALDVTSPDSFSAANAATIARWEFSDATDSDLGYVLGRVSPRGDLTPNQVYLDRDGNGWLVIGNGVASDSSDRSVGTGNAYLFVIRAAGPTGPTWQHGVDYFKIRAGTETANGLAMPFLVDADGDGRIDSAYAGDLRGNVWKFDLSAASPSNWRLGNGGRALFTARSAGGAVQPITAAPVVARLDPRIGGVFVVVGTGKFYERADSSDASQQSLYGLWDNGSAIGGRGVLVAQTLSASGSTYRTLSSNTVCLSTRQAGCGGDGASLSRGWYIDLERGGSTPSERVVFNPTVDESADLLVTTMLPGSVDNCDGDGVTWFIRMSLMSGGSLKVPLYDTNGDGLITSADRIVSAAKTPGGGSGVPARVRRTPGPGDTTPPCFVAQGDSSGQVGQTRTACARLDTGRLNWREIVR
ncbi:MAG: PilC/PilY family type IV pilus protein [Burkholderiales bacterium]